MRHSGDICEIKGKVSCQAPYLPNEEIRSTTLEKGLRAHCTAACRVSSSAPVRSLRQSSCSGNNRDININNVNAAHEISRAPRSPSSPHLSRMLLLPFGYRASPREVVRQLCKVGKGIFHVMIHHRCENSTLSDPGVLRGSRRRHPRRPRRAAASPPPLQLRRPPPPLPRRSSSYAAP